MKITIEVPSKVVIDCMNNAGSRYWARDLTWNGTKGHVTEHGGEGLNHRHSISLRRIKKGLALLAAKNPSRFAELTRQDYDAETGDILLQLMVFGEVKYG